MDKLFITTGAVGGLGGRNIDVEKLIIIQVSDEVGSRNAARIMGAFTDFNKALDGISQYIGHHKLEPMRTIDKASLVHLNHTADRKVNFFVAEMPVNETILNPLGQ